MPSVSNSNDACRTFLKISSNNRGRISFFPKYVLSKNTKNKKKSDTISNSIGRSKSQDD